MSPIRILHVMNDFSDSSISRIVERIIQNMRHGDFEWHVGALNEYEGMKSVFENLGVTVAHFSPRKNIRRSLRAYILDQKINIVHTHSVRTIMVMYPSIMGMRVRPRHITTKHTLMTPKDRRWGIIFTALDYVSLHLPDRLAVVSGDMAERVTALPGVQMRRVFMVRNAIPSEDFYHPQKRDAARLELGFDPEQLVFGFTGRIEPVKLLHLLLQAFANVHALHPETRLILVGDGSLRAELQQYTHQLGLANAAIWLGHRTDVPSLLAAMDVYVQSSHNEGMSLSILEAMAAGKPVISTDVGGAREVLRSHENGLLVRSHSSEALFEAMLELITHPELRVRYGEAAREQVLTEFSLQKMVDTYGRIYHSLITGE